MTPSKTRTYEELEIVSFPEDVPELGVEAGDEGVIAHVYNGGKMLDVEVGHEDGTSAGFIDLGVSKDGSLSVAGYSLLSG